MMTKWAKTNLIKAYEGKRDPIRGTLAINTRTGEHLEHSFFYRGEEVFLQLAVEGHQAGDRVEVSAEKHLMFAIDIRAEDVSPKGRRRLLNYEFAHFNSKHQLELDPEHVVAMGDWDQEEEDDH